MLTYWNQLTWKKPSGILQPGKEALVQIHWLLHLKSLDRKNTILQEVPISFKLTALLTSPIYNEYRLHQTISVVSLH